MGKSTTVLACARAGAGFLGDDLVLVDAGDGADDAELTAHCLFATAKLTVDSARALDAETWPRPRHYPQEQGSGCGSAPTAE